MTKEKQKMKKLFTLALILITGLVIFSGCDNLDNPVETKNIESNLTKCNIENNDYTYYIMTEITTIENSRELYRDGGESVELTFFLEVINNAILNNEITLKKQQLINPYQNKLNAAINMIENGEYAEAKIKIEDDLQKHLKVWVTSDTQCIDLLLELTRRMLKLSIDLEDPEIILNPEFQNLSLDEICEKLTPHTNSIIITAIAAGIHLALAAGTEWAHHIKEACSDCNHKHDLCDAGYYNGDDSWNQYQGCIIGANSSEDCIDCWGVAK